MTARLRTHPCPTCGEDRLFRLVTRDDRHRMVCSECSSDLPARDGPVADWRDLLEGARTGEAPDDGRRRPD